MRPERRAGKPGAAAEIEHGAEPQRAAARMRPRPRRAAAPARDRRAARPAPVEARRILVEQRAHIGRRHRRRRVADAEPRELQAARRAVLGIGVARLLRTPRPRRRGRPASRASRRARTRPGQSPARSRAPGQQVGGRREIAALQHSPCAQAIAPVGDQVAGGDEQRCAAIVGPIAGLAMRADMTYLMRHASRRPSDADARPASAASPAASISTRRGRSTRPLITHGHSDHARPGHGAVLATQETLDIMRLRYGENFAGTTQAIALRRDA